MAATTAEKIAFHAANVARTAPRLEAPPLRERAPRVEHDRGHRERRAAELLPIQVRAQHDVGPEQQTSHLELAEDLVRQRAQAADDHVARRRRPRAEHLRSVSR